MIFQRPWPFQHLQFQIRCFLCSVFYSGRAVICGVGAYESNRGTQTDKHQMYINRWVHLWKQIYAESIPSPLPTLQKLVYTLFNKKRKAPRIWIFTFPYPRPHYHWKRNTPAIYFASSYLLMNGEEAERSWYKPDAPGWYLPSRSEMLGKPLGVSDLTYHSKYQMLSRCSFSPSV